MQNFSFVHFFLSLPLSFFLCSPSCITQKLKGINECSSYQTTALYWTRSLSGLEPHVSYNWWAMAPNMLHSHFLILLHVTQHYSGYRAHMNIVHTKQLVYYQRCLFSGLEMHTSNNWWATVPNMHHGLCTTCHLIVRISCITQNSWDACNSITLLKTPLLPRMLYFCWKQQSSYNLQATCIWSPT